MSTIPIKIEPLEIHIHADRRLAFQVITAFGAKAPGSSGSSKVLKEEDGRLLVEFKTQGRNILGRRTVHRTVELVDLYEPERVEFEAVESPLAMMKDRFILIEEEGCTCLRYESAFTVKGWLAGWLLGMLYVRRSLTQLMKEHMTEIKEVIEARAKNSCLFPQQPCGLLKTDDDNAEQVA